MMEPKLITIEDIQAVFNEFRACNEGDDATIQILDAMFNSITEKSQPITDIFHRLPVQDASDMLRSRNDICAVTIWSDDDVRHALEEHDYIPTKERVELIMRDARADLEACDYGHGILSDTIFDVITDKTDLVMPCSMNRNLADIFRIMMDNRDVRLNIRIVYHKDQYRKDVVFNAVRDINDLLSRWLLFAADNHMNPDCVISVKTTDEPGEDS